MPESAVVLSTSELLGESGANALEALAALGQQTRLAIFRFLVNHEPCGRTVGEIALAMGSPQNTTSGHLAVLARGGLVGSTRRGRSVVYRADLAGMQRLLEYLLADCCNGDSTACATVFSSLCADGCKHPAT
jgi:ArsR family transcriptional regulator, arsenate/arsenite/antimonite-responsive transcriptional repressor